ncbi:GNAT family N-acetyltransferase [Alteromonas sp. 1_MG-2023]|uniref:GNAT family N-acetyltransferase n=1 Tax=Alteromonas sp. 1_MG-2023 TaxID=3062669 RepID=UPI0026E191A4|nr:GNAT family N-acetyltransferase [Alteromonas sp. 1_MG-2023]MDO6566312.1 GNAT family N-acetyltransferase [Alteromonas sp. 1_MG-2023]
MNNNNKAASYLHVCDFSKSSIASIETASIWAQSGKISFFQSQHWFEAWVNSLPEHANVDVITFYSGNDELVGFTLLGKARLNRFLPCAKQLFLNQTNSFTLDQVWVEFNKIHAIKRFEDGCSEQLLKRYFNSWFNVRIHLSMLLNSTSFLNIARVQGYNFSSQKIAGYRRNLVSNDTIETIIKSLSKNSRHQLTRSLKKLNSLCGEIKVEPINNRNYTGAFNELASLHKQRWGNTEHGSGFDNPYFVAHHKYLFDNHPERVELIAVKAGELLLGICYNFLSNKKVEFYCSGVNENVPDKHIKSGYLIHVALMAHYASLGYQVYDFLGGEAQYKRTIANEKYHFESLTIWNNSTFAKTLWFVNKVKTYLNRFVSKL